MNVRPFGEVDGRPVVEVAIRTIAGAEARIITWGAVLRDLVVPAPAGPQHVVLGLSGLDDYLRALSNFGAIVGRYANRIADARFRLDGRDVRLLPNEDGSTLHGGPNGFGKRVWSLLDHDESSAHLALVSDDGDAGFPGRLFATCSYEMVEPATLRITLQAICDQATPVNLTTHTYYNLDGVPDVREHLLEIGAGHITPTDGRLIPTGDITPVAGTAYDFRQARSIRGSGAYQDLDINFVLSGGQEAEAELKRAASLASSKSGVRLDLWTTEPGLQVYDGGRVVDQATSLSGVSLGPYCGIALEPQRFPDGPNRAHFPPCILRPGEVSRQVSELRFSTTQIGDAHTR